MAIIRSLLDIPSVAPDDRRRSQLLIILLLGVGGLTLLTLIVSIVVVITGVETLEQNILLLLTSLGLLVNTAFILFVNRYWSVWLASSLFLLCLTVAMVFVEAPQEVVDGRGLLYFAIPIIMSSVLLPSYASFIMAGLISLLITGVALNAQIVPNPYAMFGFVGLALVTWLSARSLEQALADLRTINLELDQRVEERTQELAEALTREQAEASKNQAILEGIADGVIVFDTEGQAIVANPAVAHLIERPSEAITGYDIETLMNDHVDATDREMVLDLLNDKDAHAPSVRLDWGPKTLSVSVAPVRVASDEVTGTVAVFRDFTREAEVERMKSTFVSMVSHDLRTPLSVIMGYADMLQEALYGSLTDEQGRVVERINASAGRLLSLVNNLLDQARIEAGKLELNVVPFTPADLLADMRSVMDVVAESKELELACHVDEDLPHTLYGDAQRLHQILVNLVNNALKFTAEGAVSVRVYRFDTDHWAIDVSDTGAGIPLEAQSRVFDAFWQVDGSVTRRHSGVGLGLSIVQQLTSLMGGTIKLASEMGQGSTFTIVLPLTPVQEEAA